MYRKFVNFYNDSLKNYTNNDVLLIDNIKRQYFKSIFISSNRIEKVIYLIGDFVT